MKKLFITFVIIVAVLGVGYFFARSHITNNSLTFINRATGIILPPGTTTRQIFDNEETSVAGKFIIKPTAADTFIFVNDLVPISGSPFENGMPQRIFSLFGNLDTSQGPKVINHADFYYRSGHNKHKAWAILLNKLTGEIWIDVEYPHWGGHNLHD